MESAYRIADWQPYWNTIAGISAAFAGLLFVALSVNRALLRDLEYRGRARAAISAALILVLLALVVLIPAQSRQTLGWELLVCGLALEAYGARLQRQTLGQLAGPQRARWLARIAAIHAATLAVPLAGASLLVGRYGGLYWLVPTVLFYLVWAAYNGWVLLDQQTGEEGTD